MIMTTMLLVMPSMKNETWEKNQNEKCHKMI